MKRLHYFSGIVISLFVGLHLLNHLYSLRGADAHIEMMEDLRIVYRNIVAETILLIAVLIQVFSGIKLFLKKRKNAIGFFEKLQVWTGLYLAFFFLIHLTAVFTGRLVLNLDTNFYFGVAGLNTFPLNLFFIPYYGLAIISFFGHISALHSKKMKNKILGVDPLKQSYIILIIGTIVSLAILFGSTKGFTKMEIPKEYELITSQSLQRNKCNGHALIF